MQEQVLSFPPFRLDLVNEQLWREEQLIALRPKTFAILRYLVERPNRLVTKDEILHAVWGDTQVSEDGLRDYLREIRRALGDDAEAPRFVETVRGRGYRFLAAVTIQPVSSAKWQVPSSVPFPTPNPQPPIPSAALPLPDKPSIIVLPFINLSNDPDQDYFSDGITEDITNSLSRISSLFVISRTSAFTYKGKPTKIQDISKEMGVQYVLEGSVRRANDQVRITVQLIDAIADHHLWAERYDRELKDIFALQDEIVQRIVTTLKLQLTLWEQGVLVRKRTDNLEAYDCFLRGLDYFRRTAKEMNAQAQQMFERAIALDPTYAAAYATLGWTYFIEWLWQWNSDPQMLERTVELAQKALALDASWSLAHALLGQSYLWTKQNEQAIAAQERAVALDPNNGDVYALLAEALSWSGRPAEALGFAQQALRLNPLTPAVPLFEVGLAYQSMGQYEGAITAYKKALLSNPYFEPARIGLAGIYGQLGREAEARVEGAAILRMNPNFSVEMWRQRFPAKDPAVAEWWIEGLRKAGLR